MWLMAYIGMCGPKGYGFSRFGHKIGIYFGYFGLKYRVWFLHSSLEFGMFIRRSYFSIVINKNISKSPPQCLNIGLNYL